MGKPSRSAGGESIDASAESGETNLSFPRYPRSGWVSHPAQRVASRSTPPLGKMGHYVVTAFIPQNGTATRSAPANAARLPKNSIRPIVAWYPYGEPSG